MSCPMTSPRGRARYCLMPDYTDLSARIRALTHGETDEVSLMATLACEIHHSDDRFDWTGFYRVTQPELLKIGPYQGGHGCLVIPFSRGVCGAAARTRSWSRMWTRSPAISPAPARPGRNWSCRSLVSVGG